MVNFPGSLVCKTSTFGHQRLVLLLPWLKKNSCNSFSRTRVYSSSSFPVRYIPNKSSKTKETKTSPMPMMASEDKEMRRDSDPNVLRVEVSNGSQRSCVLDEKSQSQQNQNQRLINKLTFGAKPVQAAFLDASVELSGVDEEEVGHDLRVEVSNGSQRSFVLDEKSQSQQNQNQRLINKLTFGAKPGVEEEEVGHDLRVEVSNGSQRSFVLDEKSQSQQNQNQRLINTLTFGTKPGVEEEEVGHDLGIVDHELLDDHEEIVEELEIHQGKDSHNQDALRAGKTKRDAETLAIELLATRAFTAVELRKKLHGKRFHLDIVDAVITDFQCRGLINDYLYAETFSRSRWSSSYWGPMRIKQALFKKGVSEVDAVKAIKLVFEDGDSGGDQESIHGLSKLSMDHLIVQATKQWLRSRNVPCETRKSRIIRWLQYRGFNWGVITFILKKLESKYPP